MPIYEYRCSSCGFEKEYLQKLSDAPITVCEQCGQATMSKLVSAAGFQLKGSGWYVTDFRNGSANKPKEQSAAKSETAEAKPEPKPESKTESKTDSSSSGTDTGAKSDSQGSTTPASAS